MENKIKALIQKSIEANKTLLSKESLSQIGSAAAKMIDSIKTGGKILIFGNGGSAADSQHMAAELVGRLKKERKPISAISLTTDTSILTSLSNDYGYDVSFKRQVEAHGKKGDIALGISTSGNAKNVIEAFKMANANGLSTILLTGKSGGSAKKEAGTIICVDSADTARIQEAHILIIHIICELLEDSVAI